MPSPELPGPPTCVNISNTRSRSPAASPAPLSDTVSCACAGVVVRATPIRPPEGV